MSSIASALAPRRLRKALLAKAGTVLLAATLVACGGPRLSDAEAPDVSLAGLSFAEAGLFEQGFTLQLRLKNPNEFDIPVQAMNFSLDVNGASFAEGRSSKDFTLPASSEIVVPFDIAITTQDLIDRVTAIGTGRRLDYQLTGSAEIDSWFSAPVPFDRSGKLALPDIPGLFQENEAASAPTG